MPETESSCHVDSIPFYQHVFLSPKAGSPCTIQASARLTGLCPLPDPRASLLARSQGLFPWASLTPAQPHQQGPGSAFSSRTQLQTPVSAVASQQLGPGLFPASNQVLLVRSHTDVGIINEAKSRPTNLQNRSLTKNSTLEPTDDNK